LVPIKDYPWLFKGNNINPESFKVPVTEENKVVLENQQSIGYRRLVYRHLQIHHLMFFKPGTLSLICVSIYYKRIKPQGAEYDEGFLFRLYVNLYVVASIGSKTHLVEYWHSVIPFFLCTRSSLGSLFFSRKISNHVDSSSEFN
jgi:hypothetical protein